MNRQSHKEPKISIIVPSFNQGQYIRQCIESILDQQYSSLELIIIDGGSEDNSVDIIREYENDIDYWISEKDEGQSNAINKGFKEASGELVAWLNSDDFYLPNAFLSAVEVYRDFPEASFYFGNGWRVDAYGNKKTSFFKDNYLAFDREALLYGLNYILQPSTFINAHYLKRIGYLDETLHYGMDSDLWMRLSGEAPPAPVLSCLAASREYGETKTSTGSFKRCEELRLISRKYTGAEMTPGALCYFLDTLHRFSQEREDIFSKSFRIQLEAFWGQSQKTLTQYGCDHTGFPSAQNLLSKRSLQISELSNADTGRPKIGIDLRNIVIGQSGGISQLIRGLFQEIFSRDSDFDYIVFCTIFSRSLLPSDADNVSFLTLPLKNYYAALDKAVKQHNVSLLFRGYPLIANLSFPLSKQIFLIPDIQHETFPDFFADNILRERRKAFDQALAGAGAIATISEYAQQTLARQPITQCTDIFLTPPALQKEYSAVEVGKRLPDELTKVLESKYFLYPANLWPHKNHRLVLQAFGQFVERVDQPVFLILTGNKQGWEELKQEFQNLPVVHMGFVSTLALQALYENAVALAFFSLYEGFGMPLLEAFNSGTPVICSNTTSLPEVGGDAVLSCNPTDVDAISQLMEQVFSDENLRLSLIDKGRNRLNHYAWSSSANDLESAFKRVINGSKSVQKLTTDAVVNTPPIVSIVTPSFNQGRFIKRTIESVLTQSYPNIEYIVVDGGSTDETIEILKSYGDRLTWLSESDNGQTDAINKGFTFTKGTIRAYLNSDDVLLPDAISKVVHYLQTHPNCDLVYGQANYIDEADNVIGKYSTAPYSFDRLMYDCCVCQPATFWRTSLSNTIGPFDDKLHYVMDYEYWLRAACSGAGIHDIPTFLANSRLYPETKTLSAREAIYKEIFQVCLALGGYVSLNYVTGLWHYLCVERDTGWPARLAWIPKFQRTAAYFHHKWLNRKRYNPAFIRMVWQLRGKPKVLRILERYRLLTPIKKLRKLSSPVTKPASASSVKRVKGIGYDNWMERVCEINLSKPYRQGRLHIAGITPIDMNLKISSNDSDLGIFKLRSNRYEIIEFDLEFDKPQCIRFYFSNSFVSKAGRKVSFLLQDTNLFLEQDLI
ncbi:MAG: glycosyltransferase [Cyanobacteria bacterium P01_H01_bin.26]